MGTSPRQRIVVVHFEDVKAVISRMTGALVRAFLIMVLIATPSAILPGTGTDTQQMVALIALCGGALTYAEYNATYPSITEFRDAPPFNRIRYCTLLITVFMLSAIQAAPIMATPINRFCEAIGLLFGTALDFPYSPVRLATMMLTTGADPQSLLALRTAAATAYIISLFALAIFVISLKLRGWPSRNQAFNVWVNLPTFEPTVGGDVVDRLERDARFNLSLGFLLPFVVPGVVILISSGIHPMTLTAPQTLIWAMTAWAFLPASLLMRGVAMRRIADMIRSRRAATALGEEPELAAVH